MCPHLLLSYIGITINVDASRHWSKSQNGHILETKPFKKWSAVGGIIQKNEELTFTYTGNAENEISTRGETTDLFPISEEEFNDEITNGTFKHVRNDGKVIYGNVRIRKIGLDQVLSYFPNQES